MLILLLIYLLTVPAAPTSAINTDLQDQWWQREKQQPTENQIINPRYLEKKRELEIALDDLEREKQARAYFRSLGQKTMSIDASIKDLHYKIQRLEHELSQIPMYIIREREPIYLPDPSSTEIEITTKVEANKDEDTDILIGSGENLKARILLDQMSEYFREKGFDNLKKRVYLEAFVKDWPVTEAAREANVMLDEIKKDEERKRIEEKRTVFQGRFELKSTPDKSAFERFVYPENEDIFVEISLPRTNDFVVTMKDRDFNEYIQKLSLARIVFQGPFSREVFEVSGDGLGYGRNEVPRNMRRYIGRKVISNVIYHTSYKQLSLEIDNLRIIMDVSFSFKTKLHAAGFKHEYRYPTLNSYIKKIERTDIVYRE